MAEVFAHPLSLIYHVGKNLVLNGVDIFKNIAQALISYGAKDYYSFGKYVGQAMDSVFLKAPYPKKTVDLEAYEFFDGFYSALNANSQLDQQQLYNNIDGLGLMVYGPVKESMQEFERNDVAEEMKVWMTVHEISHTLLEGSRSLVAKGALTEANRQDILVFGNCLNEQKPSDVNDSAKSSFRKSYIFYQAQQTDAVGYVFGTMAVRTCHKPAQTKFLSEQ